MNASRSTVCFGYAVLHKLPLTATDLTRMWGGLLNGNVRVGARNRTVIGTTATKSHAI